MGILVVVWWDKWVKVFGSVEGSNLGGWLLVV